MPNPPTDTDAPPVGTLKSGSLGSRGILFLVVSAAAPLTVVAGTVPLAILIAGAAAPTAYLVVGVVLAIFALAFMAMTKHVTVTGGFYTYITQALGKHVGLGAGILALVSYNAMQIGIYGLFAVSTRTMLQIIFGIEVPWGWITLIAVLAVGAMGFSGIDLGAKVLGVLLIAETLILVILGVAIVVTGGNAGGFKFGSFDPQLVFTPQFAATIGLAFGAFIGFESTVLYRAEARDPHRTIPRATYAAVFAMTIFYFVIVWIFIQAYGEQLVQAFIGENSVETFVFITAETRVGHWANIALVLLIVTSVYAALLAFHNSINRYTYALARDGVLPAFWGKTSARTAAPWVAGLIQTSLALVITSAFALADADPYLQLLIWLNTPGVIGILLLQFLAAVAVIVFFVRRPQIARGWYVLPAGILAAALMAVFAVLIVANVGVLTGAPPLTNAIIVGVVPVTFVIGVVMAEVMRRRRPEAFERIGGQES